MDFILGHYEAFGLEYAAKFATRPEKRIGDDAMWDRAEAALRSALEATGRPTRSTRATAPSTGRRSTSRSRTRSAAPGSCGTIQLDYAAPERFDLNYVGEDNAEHRPVVIHRAVCGSFERFIAILIEHFAGAFPLWLAPVQAIVLPIADRHLDYAREVAAELDQAGLRVEVDDRQEKVNYKIREAQLQKIPYMLVVGDKEVGRPRRGRPQPEKGRFGRPAAGSVRDRRACRGPG